MKDEEIKQSIAYRPNLYYEEDYSSDIDGFSDSTSDNPIDLDDTVIDDIINQIPVIDNLIDKLPGDLADSVTEVTDQIFDFIEEELQGKDYDEVPEEEEWDYIPVDPVIPDTDLPGGDDDDNEDNDDDDYTEDSFWEDDDCFPIKKEEHTKEEIIEKEYIKNLTDLMDDYFTNLHTILSEFWLNLIPAIYDKPQNEIEIILNNIILNNGDVIPGATHLLDSAVRTQIIKSMKFNYFTQLFNAEKTIIHLNQFKATYLLRLRYANIEKVNGETKTNQMSNNILKAMEKTYDKRYDVAFENLYRYLKSSNKVLGDLLQTMSAEIKSKQTLIERKGIK